MSSYRHLAVSAEVFDKVMEKCVEEFLLNNPKFRGMHLTQNMIINRIANYYLGEL